MLELLPSMGRNFLLDYTFLQLVHCNIQFMMFSWSYNYIDCIIWDHFVVNIAVKKCFMNVGHNLG